MCDLNKIDIINLIVLAIVSGGLFPVSSYGEDRKMSKINSNREKYHGFEQGPIRPPNEARSLLIRVTRNCPWNRCAFCPVYKNTRFSLRPVAHVIQDIDMVAKYTDILKNEGGERGQITQVGLDKIAGQVPHDESQAFRAAFHWYGAGMRSIFLQDANSLILPPVDMIAILEHLKKRFYWVQRITSYARSHTIARIKDQDLSAMACAGLNRIHIGLESGSDQVLKLVKKGATKDTHIKAGQKVRKAGLELSEYVMPGLGGKALSTEHALETADALNQINPNFVRLRTLAIPKMVPLFDDWEKGRFIKPTDIEICKEILLFIESLKGIGSVIKSDHILNLFEDVEGTLPRDKEKMTVPLRLFLSMAPQQQCLFQVGRRLGIFRSLRDMEGPRRLARVEKVCQENGITHQNVDRVINEMIKRFI